MTSVSDYCTFEVHDKVKNPHLFTAAVIIQGMHHRQATETVIEQLVSKNKNILLIVSVVGHNISVLERDLIDEGKAVYIFLERPGVEKETFWKTNFANQNYQRLTSYAGLKYAESLGIQYSLKIRSDVFLGMNESIRHFIDLIQKYPLMPRPGKVVDMLGRIVVGSHATITHPDVINSYAPFHIRDHWYFGFTRDLVRFFDLASPTWAGGAGIAQCSPESSLTVVWMKDLGIEATDARELLARYFIVEDYVRVEQCRTDDPKFDHMWVMDMEDYKLRGAASVSDFINRVENPKLLTSHEEWKSMLRAIMSGIT